jgi:tetratricopeptide (TPR) repeat protein
MRKLLFVFLSLSLWGSALSAEVALYKKETTETIFNQLIKARGDYGGRPKPKLVFVTGTSELAKIIDQTIFIGEKAYDVCASMGKDSLNAIAFLLAHELTHYYMEHTWEEEFSRGFVEAEVEDHWLEDEIQADLFGGLLAFSSGYKVSDVIPDFLPKLYEAYGKQEDLPGYQSLSQRIDLCKATAYKIELLTQYFETANYLVALEMYEEAAAYYLLIQKEGYRSREVSNNLGVYYTMAATKFFRKSELPYGLPIELDAEARINESKKGFDDPDDPEVRRLELLDLAIEYFEEAQNLDPEYSVALLNLGCAYALKGTAINAKDPDLAEEHFLQAQLFSKRAKRGKNAKTKLDALVLNGFLEAIQKEDDDAISTWEKAKEKGSSLAAANLEVLREGVYSIRPNRLPKSNDRELIDQLSLDLYKRRPDFDTLVAIQVGMQQTEWGRDLKNPKLSNSYIMAHMASPAHYALLHITADDYPGKSLLGVQRMDSREKLIQAYRDPNHIVQLAQGEFLVYSAREIIFQLDEKGKIVGWCVFRMNSNRK